MIRPQARRWGKAKLLSYGALVRAARELRGLRPREFCAQLGMSLSQLSDIERGIGTLPLRRARQMAEVLGVSFAEVVCAVLQDRLYEAGFTWLRVTIADTRDESQVHRRP